MASAAVAQEAAYGTAAMEIAEKIAQAFPKVEGRVIGLEAQRVLVDLGQKSGVIPGLELQVFREGQEFKHPYTGQVLGRLDRDVGRVRIVDVRPNFSLAEVIQQSEGTMVQQGDHIRVTSARVILALPNVDVSDVAGANTRAVTRDLTNALVKTNRFEVMADQRLRAALQDEKVSAPDQFTEPATLQALWKRLRVAAVLLGKLSLTEKGIQWDVQVVSTVRGDSVTLASVEVKGAAPRTVEASGRQGARGIGGVAGRIDQITLHSEDLPFRGQAMAVGDLTGDGSLKLAVSDGQTIYVYGLERAAIKEIARINGSGLDNIIAVDAADINGNGVPEIFVTNHTEQGVIRSLVLEYRDRAFQRIWTDAPLHFRVLEDATGKRRLYGQGGLPTKAFDGPVREYVWQGNAYVPGAVVPLPKAYPTLYGFNRSDLDKDGGEETVVLDHMDYLRVYDRAGTEIHRSGEHYGGSEVNVDYYPPGVNASSNMSSIEPTRVNIQGRIFFRALAEDGKPQLIVYRNTPSTGYFFRTRLYDRGKFLGLAWDGVGLQPDWETRELPGFVADFAPVDVDGSGKMQLLALVVKPSILTGRSRTLIVLLTLQPPR